MKVIVKGAINVDQLAKKLIEVADSTVQRVQAENEGVVINGYSVNEAEVSFKFDVDGMDEPMLLTVEHHEGQSEVLTWVVDMDAEDVIVASNEKESLFDEWTVARANGQELQFSEIESEYSLAELTDLDEEATEMIGDMSKVVYNHADGFKVVQVIQSGKLIQEYKLIPVQN